MPNTFKLLITLFTLFCCYPSYSNANAGELKDKYLSRKNFWGYVTTDEYYLNTNEGGTYLKYNKEDSVDNPTSQFRGFSLGVSYQVPETNILVSVKTNRLVNLQVSRQAELYVNNTLISNVSVQSRTVFDSFGIGYRVGLRWLPYIYISNVYATESYTVHNTFKNISVSAITYGTGLTYFITEYFIVSGTLLMPSNTLQTSTSFSLGVGYIFH